MDLGWGATRRALSPLEKKNKTRSRHQNPALPLCPLRMVRTWWWRRTESVGGDTAPSQSPPRDLQGAMERAGGGTSFCPPLGQARALVAAPPATFYRLQNQNTGTKKKKKTASVSPSQPSWLWDTHVRVLRGAAGPAVAAHGGWRARIRQKAASHPKKKLPPGAALQLGAGRGDSLWVGDKGQPQEHPGRQRGRRAGC